MGMIKEIMERSAFELEGYFLYPSASPNTVKTAPANAPSICFHPKPGEPPIPIGSAAKDRIKMTAPTPNRTAPDVFLTLMLQKGFDVYSDFKSLNKLK
jgi:hypothetical protein